MHTSELVCGNSNLLNQVDLTIAIPSYRRTATLKIAIDSVLALFPTQGLSYCLLISEDHSDCHKEIQDIITSYKSEKIVYYYNKQAFGMCGNWNHCFELSKSKWVALLHDDDYLLPEYLQVAEKVISGVNFDVMYFDHELLCFDKMAQSSRNGIKGFYDNLQKDKLRRITFGDCYWGSCCGKYVPTCGCIINRQKMLDFGGYKLEDGFSADEIFVARYLDEHKVYYFSHQVAVYRYADTNITNQDGTKQAFVLEGLKYRIELGNSKAFYKICNYVFQKGFIVALAGPWYQALFPNRPISQKERVLAFCYDIAKRIYIYSRGVFVGLFGRKVR